MLAALTPWSLLRLPRDSRSCASAMSRVTTVRTQVQQQLAYRARSAEMERSGISADLLSI
jgi:hypothetical protein